MQTIVIGSLNTDLVATGVKHFPQPGEHVYGQELLIGPGGKSRNIAAMIAQLSPPRKQSVAMIGRTVNDPYGLWKVPLDALKSAGVNTDYIVISDYEKVRKLPGVAFIPVNEQGQNQIFVLPGASDDFCVDDIDNATELFENVGKYGGILALTLECPLATAIHAVELANKFNLKVMFDPGGIEKDSDISELIKSGIFLIKPNEHEAKILTGVEITDFESAKSAAAKLHDQGIENVLITIGSSGAYLFTKDVAKHIPIPKIDVCGSEKDETGCGDQTMAALCAFVQQGKSLEESATLAIRAGSLQFYRTGVQPLNLSELVN